MIILAKKPTLTRFGGTIGTLKFHEKSFFNNLLGFTVYWDYKLTDTFHAESWGVYTSEKTTNLGTIDKSTWNVMLWMAP